MAVVFGTLLALFSLAVIAYPFVRSRHYRLSSDRFIKSEGLRADRSRIYGKMVDLKADFEGGDLTKLDYFEQQNRLRVEIEELARSESESGLSKKVEQLEKEIELTREQAAERPRDPKFSK